MQTRLQSAIESATNIAVGLMVSMAANAFIFPIYGWEISAGQNAQLAVIYTVISFVRGYLLRRFYNRIHNNA